MFTEICMNGSTAPWPFPDGNKWEHPDIELEFSNYTLTWTLKCTHCQRKWTVSDSKTLITPGERKHFEETGELPQNFIDWMATHCN